MKIKFQFDFKWRKQFMAKLDEILAVVNATNDVVTEIDNDVKHLLELLANIPEDGLTAEEATEIKTQLEALHNRLIGVAAQHQNPGESPA